MKDIITHRFFSSTLNFVKVLVAFRKSKSYLSILIFQLLENTVTWVSSGKLIP